MNGLQLDFYGLTDEWVTVETGEARGHVWRAQQSGDAYRLACSCGGLWPPIDELGRNTQLQNHIHAVAGAA